MSAKLLALLFAGLAGLAMAVQGSLNSSLGKTIGVLEAIFIVHFSAAVVLAAALFLLHWGSGSWGLWREAAWYSYLGGVLGILITYGVVISIPKVGVAPATTAIIALQVITALLIDQFGIFGMEKIAFNWLRLMGVLFLAAGSWLMLR